MELLYLQRRRSKPNKVFTDAYKAVLYQKRHACSTGKADSNCSAERSRKKTRKEPASKSFFQSPFNPFFIPFKGKKIKKSLALITEKMYNLSRQNAAWITLNTFIRWWFRHDYADAYRSRALKKTYF